MIAGAPVFGLCAPECESSECFQPSVFLEKMAAGVPRLCPFSCGNLPLACQEYEVQIEHNPLDDFLEKVPPGLWRKTAHVGFQATAGKTTACRKVV